MFWSGNFIVVRELNHLLKEENVTLSQVLEADDILQECKADNKALMQFVTRPDILAELITLITEEPPQSMELAQQYRHASIACEVLTSPLSMLSERLSLDTTQMNRLCDFINRDPPLNPLLASYFSKTVEMLLERSPKQDWYLYHIVCLRVLDFFKARRDFLPNLLRHISTSAIADTFKFFIRLDDLFNKSIMEWLEEHQFLECLIQIICGTYIPEETPAPPEEPEKGQREPPEKEHLNHTDSGDQDLGPQDEENNRVCGAAGGTGGTGGTEPLSEEARRAGAARTAAVASANAAALLCDLVATGCAAEGASARSRTSWSLVTRLAGEGGVRALLQAVFTSGGAARAHAVVNGCKLLLTLLDNHTDLSADGSTSRSHVELAVAPHLPLLHQALLHDPRGLAQEGAPRTETVSVEGSRPDAVGAARVQTGALLAHLATSDVEEVTATMLTLGTPGVLVDMFFRYANNNLLHAQLVHLVRNALCNAAYRTQYARHLLVECDLLTRLMDAYEENENKQSDTPRAGYMGHVTLLLSCIHDALAEGSELARLTSLPDQLVQRWSTFRDCTLPPVLLHYCTPLGGTYPSENVYEVDSIEDTLACNYDQFSYAVAKMTMNEIGDDIANDNEVESRSTHLDSAGFVADGLGLDHDDEKQMNASKSNFLELARQRFDDDMWDEAPEGEAPGAPPDHALREVLGDVSPWDSAAEGARAGEGWAQFEGLTAAPADPFAEEFAQFWPYEGDGGGKSGGAQSGAVSLANNLLTAMSGMSPAALATLVNANLEALPLPNCDMPETNVTASLPESSAETTAAQSPGLQSPGPQSPGPQSSAETTTAQSPGPQSPAAQSPGPQSPAAQSPGPQSPAAQSPGPQSPAAQSPGPQSPAAQSPGPQLPAAQSPGPQSPGGHLPVCSDTTEKTERESSSPATTPDTSNENEVLSESNTSSESVESPTPAASEVEVSPPPPHSADR